MFPQTTTPLIGWGKVVNSRPLVVLVLTMSTALADKPLRSLRCPATMSFIVPPSSKPDRLQDAQTSRNIHIIEPFYQQKAPIINLASVLFGTSESS